MSWLVKALVAYSCIHIATSIGAAEYRHFREIDRLTTENAKLREQLTLTEQNMRQAFEQQATFYKVNVLRREGDVTNEIAAAVTTAVHKCAPQYGVDSQLVLAIMAAESNYEPRALSIAGAQGLMQVMPGVWAKHFGVRDFYDIDTSVCKGIDVFAQYRKLFSGDLALTLTAYNMGPERVIKALRAGHNPTNAYARKIIRNYNRIKDMGWIDAKIASLSSDASLR